MAVLSFAVADNVLCQLSGLKRVRCWRPDAHHALHVFPDTHPRARKAQAPVDMADMADVADAPGLTEVDIYFWKHLP